MTGSIESARDGGVCTISFRNDGKRNAFTTEMLADLAEAVEAQAAGAEAAS